MLNKAETKAIKIEEMSQHTQQTFRIYSIIVNLLGKVVGMDANEALLFVEARQWLKDQAQALVAREQQMAAAKAHFREELGKPEEPEGL